MYTLILVGLGLLCVGRYVQMLHRVLHMPALTRTGRSEHEQPLISVIIPARNEAARLRDCLDGLVLQHYQHYEVLVLDDQSTDGTAEVARQYCQRLPQLQVLSGMEIPAGWAGKPWACWQAAHAAQGAWLLFLDADVIPDPNLLDGIVRAITSLEPDLLSVVPLVQLGSLAEGLVLPAFFDLIAGIYHFDQMNQLDTVPAFAIGQCLLMRQSAYERLGGHQRVQHSILEDMELASHARAAGMRVVTLDGADLIQVRMYTGWQTVFEGLGKNAIAGLRHGGMRAAWYGIWQVASLWTPPLLVLSGLLSGAQALVMLGSWLLVIGILTSALVGWLRFRQGPAWGMLLPIGTLVYFGIAGWAALRLWSGAGVTWKERIFLKG